MKKLSGLLSFSIVALILTGCSNDAVNAPILPVQTQNQNNISAQSAQGLKTFYTVLTDKVFSLLDTNHDKALTLDEFSKRTSATSFPSSAQPADAGPVQPADFKSIFSKIDKNKNNKITITEARQSKNFLGINKLEVRQIAAKPMFDYFNKNHDKVISKDEFMGDASVNNANAATNQTLTTLFYSSDKNANGSLTFTEFEDLAYALIRTSWDLPPAPAPTPVDPNQPSPAPSEAPGGDQPAPAPGGDQPAPSDPAQPVAPDPASQDPNNQPDSPPANS